MNSSKFSAFCDKILEIGWLLAVIITPLFFNVYSSRVFEPDKLTTLRTVAVIMAAVWLARLIEEWTHGERRLGLTWRTPLVAPALATAVVYLISTLFSVTPYVSLMGSYQRLQGTFTTLSYLTLFFIVLDRLRTRAQLDRLVTVIILNSLPISLYGLIQRNGLDPLPWGGDVTKRVASNMGNSIFVAAYLIMILPLTVGRVIESFRDILKEERSGWAEILRAASYIFILAIEMVAIWFAQSRGPLLGLIAGLYILLLLLALAWRARGGAAATLAVVVATALVVAFLVTVNIPGGPLRSLQHAPWLGRLGSVFDFEGGTGRVRALIWEGMVKLVLPHPPLEQPPTRAHPQGFADPFNALRPVVGYGPESVYVAYNRFYPPLLGHNESRTASPDRSHNETLDSLAITGLLGFGAYLWTFGSLFTYGLIWLGLLRARWQRWLLLGLAVGLSLASIAFFWWWQGLHFFGAALTLGIVAALGLYLAITGVWHAWRILFGEGPSLPPLHPRHFLLIAIYAALVAHFVEINFGIAIASTRTTFWAYAAILVLVGQNALRTDEDAADPLRERGAGGRAPGTTTRALGNVTRRKGAVPLRRPQRGPARLTLPAWLGPTLAVGLISGFILGTLAFDFVTNAQRLTKPWTIVWQALTVLPAQNSRTAYGALMIFALTWALSALVFGSELARRGLFRHAAGERSDWALALLIYLLVSLVLGLGFALVLATEQAAFLRRQPTTLQELLAISDRVAGLVSAYYGLIVVVLLAGAAALSLEREQTPRAAANPWGILASVVLTGMAAAIVIPYNLRPIQADVVYKQAEPYEREGQWQIAVLHYMHAIELAPREDFYYLYLGRARLEYASLQNDPLTRDALMRQTEEVLLQAREINPLNTDHSANLARMYRRWAELTSDATTRVYLLERSALNYERATSLSPFNAILWNEWSLLYAYGLGDLTGYERTHARSLEIDPEFDQTWLICGDVARGRGQFEQAASCYEKATLLNPRNADAWTALGESQRQAKQPEQAIASFRKALALKPQQPQVWRLLADTCITQQRWDEAIAALEQVLILEPAAEDLWNVHQVLAQLYLQIGQRDLALQEAQLAAAMAPEEQLGALEALISEIQSPAAESEAGGS